MTENKNVLEMHEDFIPTHWALWWKSGKQQPWPELSPALAPEMWEESHGMLRPSSKQTIIGIIIIGM